MAKLSTTEKVLMGVGAAVVVVAAAIGITVLIKKKKAKAGEIKELVIDSDDMDDFDEEEIAE